jgi:hypothetical protein
MTRTVTAGSAFATLLVVLALGAGHRPFEQTVDAAVAAEETPHGFLYGRITTHGGATYEGRLRWGGDEEAFWGDYFNGSQAENRWVDHVPPEQLPAQDRPIEVLASDIRHWLFGAGIGGRHQLRRGKLFMARFGDIARIEARGRGVRVMLKSGAVFDLDRFEAGDFDDGVRVWDGGRGVVDLDDLRIRTIELLPTGGPGGTPDRLHGTVRTRQGVFTGFVQWDRQDCVGADELDGRTGDDELSVRFDTIRSIARRSRDSSLVTLLDGREAVLSGTREVGHGNRGMYVDDRRYGRVLVSWGAFERVDFTPGGSGPAYDDFPPGRPLTGTVTTRTGRRFVGRLVYDLDESETTETLDAPSQGVDYTIPFGLVTLIALPGREDHSVQRARVTLHGGEELQLEPTGDLGAGNAGMLIFVDGRQRPAYVPWIEVEQVAFDRPPGMYPPLGGRDSANGEFERQARQRVAVAKVGRPPEQVTDIAR